MIGFNEFLIIVAGAGLINGGVLGTLHYFMRPRRFHPVVYYTVGSACCLITSSAVAYYLAAPLWTIVTFWTVWAIAGIWDCVVYLADWLQGRNRRKWVRAKAKKDDDTW